MKRRPTPPAPNDDLAGLQARAAALADARAAAEGELRAELLAGHDTRAIRQRLAALDDDVATISADLEKHVAELEQEAAALVVERARDLAAEARGRLAALLAALKPPPAPGTSPVIRTDYD